MKISDQEFAELLPPSDAAVALSRMPPSERLPKYRRNSLKELPDLPEEAKDLLRSIGRRPD